MKRCAVCQGDDVQAHLSMHVYRFKVNEGNIICISLVFGAC